MNTGPERFVLHEEDGCYGVYDRAGPQIFFSGDREEAVREVARANEIVRRFPNTISMRHLREMDAAWRRANGLPPLPEPEGRTVVVPAELPGAAAAPTSGSAPGRAAAPPAELAAVLDTAAQIAGRQASRQRVEDARLALTRVRAAGRELRRAWIAAEPSLAAARKALREIRGAGAREAERELRAALRDVDASAGAGAYAAAARRYLSGARSAHPTAVETVVDSAPALAAWDRATYAAVEVCGARTELRGGDRARYHALLSALGRLREEAEHTLAAARADHAAACAGPGPRTLREQWRALTAEGRAAVLQVVPDLPELMRPARTRGREARRPGRGGLGR